MLQPRTTITFTILGLIAVSLLMPLPATAQATSADQLTYPPLPSFEFPKPHREVLPNGMVVLLLEDHELPLIKATALIRTGSRLEPADKVGLAELTGDVMRSGGTTNMNGDDLDDFLEARAAIIETSIGETSGIATLDVLKQDFDTVLPIFSDILRHPVFDPDKIQVAKTAMIASISRQNDTPTSILNREFPELVYGSDSPYARTPTYASVANISRNDLVDWHHRYFHPNRVVLGVVGDFDSRTMFDKIYKTFGDWPRGPKPLAKESEILYDQSPHPGVYFAAKEDVTQSNVRIGHLGIEKKNPDYYAVEVLNEVLSGSFASRLFADIRTKKGLAYAVHGGVGSSWDYPGLFSMFMSTKTATTGEGVAALLQEARDLTARPPTEEEVERAKQSILNSFVFNADSREKVLRQQLTFEYYGYPLDWLERYRKGIEAVTVDEVRRAAAAYVHPNRFAILVVGPQSVEDQLKPFGEVQQVDISIPEPKAPEVEMTEAGAEQASQLLDKAVQTMGGAKRLASIDNTSIDGTTTIHSPQGAIDVKSSVLVVYPDKLRQEAILPFGKIVTVVSPDAAFVVTPRGTQPLPDSQKQQVLKEIIHDPVTLLRARGQDGFQASVTGKDTVAGNAVALVTIKYKGETDTLAIDPESGRILAERYHGMGPGGVPGEIEKLFSDFRKVDGLEFPFATSSTLNGESISSSVVDSMSINGEVADDAFAPPKNADEGDAAK